MYLYVSLIYLLRSYKMKKSLFLVHCITLLAYTTAAFTMEFLPQPKNNVHLVIVPGQNGSGGANTRVVLPRYTLASLEKEPHLRKYKATTPKGWLWDSIDFGQANCQKHLQEVFTQLKKDDFVMYHLTSQGTTTGVIDIVKNPGRVKAVILEAPMLSGNSAIYHTVNSVINYLTSGSITGLPGISYYVLPYFAKILYPGYAPAGEQMIFNVDKLPTDLPIFIIHNTQDPQLSYADALGLYAFLRQTNDNVYFMSHYKDCPEHMELLESTDTKEIAAVNAFLQKYNLPTNKLAVLEGHDLKISTADESFYESLKDENGNLLLDPHGNSILDKSRVSPELYREFIDHYKKVVSEQKDIDLNLYQPEIKPKWLAHFNNLLIKEKKECGGLIKV